jgi:hypothetical protein
LGTSLSCSRPGLLVLLPGWIAEFRVFAGCFDVLSGCLPGIADLVGLLGMLGCLGAGWEAGRLAVLAGWLTSWAGRLTGLAGWLAGWALLAGSQAGFACWLAESLGLLAA